MSKLNKTSLISITLGICFYWLSFCYIDRSLAYFFHNHTFSKATYILLQFFTLLGDIKVCLAFILVSIIVAIFVLFKHPQNKIANNLLFMSIAMTGVIFVETSLKYLLARYRPELLFQQGLYGFHFLSHQFQLNSTPSGHASRFFVFVTGFSMIWKRLSPLFMLAGFVVCLSRLVLEFHFLSDVEFGALLGFLITLWIAKIYYSLTLTTVSFKAINSSKKLSF